MSKAIVYRDGKVTEVLDAKFVKNNTDWLTNGAPQGMVKLLPDDTDVAVNDYVLADGRVDTLGRYKEPKKAEITAARFAAETAGATISGMKIDTSRESQAMITGAALQAVVDDTYSCKWKTGNGFVALDAKTILAVAQAVRAHVQSCFDREAELLLAIENAKTAAKIEAIRWAS